jgi:hypothetical protein
MAITFVRDVLRCSQHKPKNEAFLMPAFAENARLAQHSGANYFNPKMISKSEST